jgi:hypothetical protein
MNSRAAFSMANPLIASADGSQVNGSNNGVVEIFSHLTVLIVRPVNQASRKDAGIRDGFHVLTQMKKLNFGYEGKNSVFQAAVAAKRL